MANPDEIKCLEAAIEVLKIIKIGIANKTTGMFGKTHLMLELKSLRSKIDKLTNLIQKHKNSNVCRYVSFNMIKILVTIFSPSSLYHIRFMRTSDSNIFQKSFGWLTYTTVIEMDQLQKDLCFALLLRHIVLFKDNDCFKKILAPLDISSARSKIANYTQALMSSFTGTTYYIDEQYILDILPLVANISFKQFQEFLLIKNSHSRH